MLIIMAGLNSLFIFPYLVTTPLTSGVVDSGRNVNETVKFSQQVCDPFAFMHLLA